MKIRCNVRGVGAVAGSLIVLLALVVSPACGAVGWGVGPLFHLDTRSVGACCQNNDHCTLVPEAECLSPGIWHGEWMSCLPNSCCPGPDGESYPNCRIISDSGVLFGTRYTRDAIAIPDTAGVPVFFDSTMVTLTKSPGDLFFISGQPDRLADWICDDRFYVDGTTTGVGFDSLLNAQFPKCVPIEQVLTPVPARNITGYLSDGTNCVTFRLADTQREIYGNTAIYLLRIPAPTGNCCDTATGTCSIKTEAACLALGFAWFGAGACDAQTCPVPGACCDLATGACTTTVASECGFIWTKGAPCSVQLCPLPTGACCDLATGACTTTVASECSFAWTKGAACSTQLCPLPTGACCDLATGACTTTVASECSFIWTKGAPCSVQLCPLPTGACCDPVGTCTVTPETACAVPRIWWGAGTNCTPNPCEATPVLLESWTASSLPEGLRIRWEVPLGTTGALYRAWRDPMAGPHDVAPTPDGVLVSAAWISASAEGIIEITDPAALRGVTIRYFLERSASGSRSEFLGPVEARWDPPTLAWSAGPTPFRDTVRLTPPRTGPARAEIFDPAGRLVRTLVRADGNASLEWNGRDDVGRDVPTGIYIVRVGSVTGGAVTRLVKIR